MQRYTKNRVQFLMICFYWINVIRSTESRIIQSYMFWDSLYPTSQCLPWHNLKVVDHYLQTFHKQDYSDHHCTVKLQYMPQLKCVYTAPVCSIDDHVRQGLHTKLVTICNEQMPAVLYFFSRISGIVARIVSDGVINGDWETIKLIGNNPRVLPICRTS